MDSKYSHFSKEERFYIQQRLELGDSVSKIANDLGRHRSSLYREIKRNTDDKFGFYVWLRAENIAIERAANTVRKEAFFTNISNDANILLSEQFKVRSSPEQIAFLFKTNLGINISHQTIYRHIWKDKLAGGKLYLNLRRRGKKYRVKSKSSTAEAATKITNKVSIEHRISKHMLKKEPGHYEIDTIYGLNQDSFLLTLVDIATEYTIVRKIPNKEALTVYNEIMAIISNKLLPFKSITSDNGTEFAKHQTIASELGISWYFCHPYSSWERGLNENTNGLIRDFYPKRTDFRYISEQAIIEVQNILNMRPRKTLDYLTPAQAMVGML
ncbi:MAG: IS30 family transposase [Neisseriaceae bacterium]|jgi:IS30 family transposase